MVVLSVAVCTKAGKPVVCRQFVEMTRMRIEGLVAAFPKLVGTGAKQHTYVETESVRYVYQPLEQLFLLLITNKGSNIMEDLDTLHLLSKVVPDQCQGQITEDRVSERAFELLFAFDEAITAGGYREGVTMPQIRTNLEMESHEEKLAIMIEQSKMNEAKEEARRKATMIREQNRESARLAKMGIGGGSSSGFGGGNGGGSFDYDYSKPATPPPSSPTRALSPEATSPVPARKAAGMKLGMKLGSKGKARPSSLLGAVMAEDGLDASLLDSPAAGAGSSAEAAIAAAQVAAAEAVSVVIDERITVSMTRDGALESMEVKGSLALTINNPDFARCRVLLNRGDTTGFQFQSHPNINKALYASDATLALKKVDREFPANTPIGVLKWRSQHTDESRVPIVFNVWPDSLGGGMINVNVEYTLQPLGHPLELNNVVVRIPTGTDAAPEVETCDGVHRHNPRDQCIEWHIDLVGESNASGSFEFNIPGRDTDVFFPVTVSFASGSTLCDLDLREVQSVEDDSKVRCTSSRGTAVDSYIIE